MSHVDDQEAIITIKVKLVSDVEGDPTTTGSSKSAGDTTTGKKSEETHLLEDPELDAIIDKLLQEMKDSAVLGEMNDDDIKAFVGETVEKTLTKEGVDLDRVGDLTDMVNSIDKNGISELTQFAKSPQGYLEHGFIRLLSKAGPHGALVVAIITAVLASPQLFVALVEMLGVKGGPLNQDFRYSIDEQENQQFSRMVQYSRLVGDDPVITVLTKGFVVGDADFNFNTLLDANIARTARIGLRDSALGVIDGI